ncbi:MAG TPA: HSP20 family small heat-shock protein [Polyangiaceae bacterium]|nr:HSP20 family small heat-shock protein [Polyangiaceae bacterium]
MANEVTIQKPAAASNVPAVAQAAAWDPFRTMRDLMRWDPFTALSAFPSTQGLATFAPDFEVKETKESFVFTADMPGVAEKDLQVQLSDNRLSISGKRESEKTEQNETYYATERSYGSFTRSFILPEGVDADKAHAQLKNGVLSIAIPKRPEAQPRKIAVQSK